MRNIFSAITLIGFLLLLPSRKHVYGQTSLPSGGQTGSITPHVDSPVRQMKVDLSLDANTLNKLTDKPQNPANSAFKGRDPVNGDWIVIGLPFVCCLVMFILLRNKLKGFDLKDALQENEYSKKTIQNPQYTSAALQSLSAAPALASSLPPTIEVSQSDKAKSSSRFIALITTAITWSVSVAIACFYVYMYILTGNPPDLGKLGTLLLSLGIGVVPYAFNKMSEAIKK